MVGEDIGGMDIKILSLLHLFKTGSILCMCPESQLFWINGFYRGLKSYYIFVGGLEMNIEITKGTPKYQF